MLNTIKGIFRKKSKKVTALMLVFLMALTMVPTIIIPVNATDPAAFKIIPYDISVRIEVPYYATPTNYKVYMSESSGLTDFTDVRCVLNSDTYRQYVYAVNGDKDALVPANTISITADILYYFYLVINDETTATEVVSATTLGVANYWTDTGNYDINWYTSGPPYIISTPAQLAGLAVLTNGLNGVSAVNFSGKTIKLSASLDMSAHLWTPIGSTADLSFKGTFDAGNYEISGLHTNDGAKDYQGLFGYSGSGSVIKDIGMVNGYIKGRNYVGGVVGYSYGTISNCHNTGSVSASDSVGGVAGYSYGTISNCHNTGSVSARDSVGGIAGFSTTSTISNCYNTGSVSGTYASVGGVAGFSTTSTISNCYNTGSVSSTGPYSVGGVVGNIFFVTISNCYNTGSVSGTTWVGGVVGYFYGTISNCYNTGSVSGISFVGGVVGFAYSGAVSNNYYCGYSGGVGTGSTSATDTAEQTTPFISCTSPLGKGRVTNIAELALATLNASFKAAFGITNIQYPDTYVSADTSIITVDGKTITASATNVGSTVVNGAGTNDEIKISQKALNMTDTTTGFSGEGTTVVGTVSLPVTVDTSMSGTTPISVTPGVSANPTFGVAVTLSATLTGDPTLSGKTITFILKDESNNEISLTSSSATTDSSGVATLANVWIPTAVGTYNLTVSYYATDETITGSTPITINKKSLIVTPDSALEKYYGQSDPVLTYSYSGNADGETPAFNGALSRTTGENVGNYAINFGSLALANNGSFMASNYQLDLSSTPVNFSVLSYNPTAVAVAAPNGLDNWFKSGTISLVAPAGYKISTSNALFDNTWADTIALDTADGTSKLATYYLKNTGTGTNYQNAITVQKTITYKVDKTAPVTITATYETNAFKSLLNAVSFGLFFKESVTVTLAAEDTTSGVKEFTVTMAGGTSFTVANNSTFSIQPQYIGNFSVSATDNAGNISESVAFEYLAVNSVTPVAPTVTSGDYTADSWTVNDVTLTISGSTVLSGITKYQYSKDGGANWIDLTTTASTPATASTPYNATKAVLTVTDGQDTYQFRTVSNSGINGTTSAGVSVKVDKVKPVISVTHTPTDLSTVTESNVVFTLSNTATNASGVTYYVQKDTGEFTLVSGNTYTVSTTDASTYTFKSMSGANVESAVSDGYTVNVVKPIFTAITIDTNSYTPGTWTGATVTLTLSGGLDASTFSKYQYSTNATSWSDVTGSTIQVGSNFSGTYFFRAVSRSYSTGSETTGTAVKVDKAINFTVTALDTTAPIIEGIANGETYYVDQTVTVTDTNIDTITVNGNPFTSGSKLLANKDETYIIVAIDKSGNRVTYTVTTKTIASIFDSIKYITGTNAKSTDKATIQAVLDRVNAVLGTTRNGATGEQIDALGAIKVNTSYLLTKTGENGMELMMIGGLMLVISGSIMFLFISRRAQVPKATKRV